MAKSHKYIILALLLIAEILPLQAQVMDVDSIDLHDLRRRPYQYAPDDFIAPPDTILKSGPPTNSWFPSPEKSYFNMTIIYRPGFLYDKAWSVRPAGLVQMKAPFTNKYIFSNDNRNIYEKNDLETYDDFHERSYSAVGFDFRYSYKLPILLRFHSAFSFNEGLLFAVDKDRQFLNHDGKLENVNELGTVYLDEVLISSGIGIEIPIWGWFRESLKGANYYYVFSKLSYNYPLSSEATQYSQILDPKKKLRYENGCDTVRVLTEETLDNLNYERLYLETGFGFNFDIEKIGFNMDFFLHIPLNSVLKDEDWRQYMFGVEIGFHLKKIFDYL